MELIASNKRSCSLVRVLISRSSSSVDDDWSSCWIMLRFFSEVVEDEVSISSSEVSRSILDVVSNPWRFTVGNWLCDSDLVNPTRIDRVLTKKDLLVDSYSDLEASILNEKEFLLLKVISTLPELSCLICSMVRAGRGTDGVALSMTHFSGRVTSSHFMVLGRETLVFVISVINKVVSPLCGFKRTLDAQVFVFSAVFID
ncbi:hypothetical protein GmHk_17G049759 [Glycine max]|nr:hypothetical protein GmHk_17G049759 [Glycine max]